MKRKPLEKLSDRLVKHFLMRVKKYNYHYFDMLTSTTKACTDYTPLDLAKKLTEQVMGMIAEYEPEDIEPWRDRLARVTKKQMNMVAIESEDIK